MLLGSMRIVYPQCRLRMATLSALCAAIFTLIVPVRGGCPHLESARARRLDHNSPGNKGTVSPPPPSQTLPRVGGPPIHGPHTDSDPMWMGQSHHARDPSNALVRINNEFQNSYADASASLLPKQVIMAETDFLVRLDWNGNATTNASRDIDTNGGNSSSSSSSSSSGGGGAGGAGGAGSENNNNNNSRVWSRTGTIMIAPDVYHDLKMVAHVPLNLFVTLAPFVLGRAPFPVTTLQELSTM